MNTGTRLRGAVALAGALVLAGCGALASGDQVVTLAIQSEPAEGMRYVPDELTAAAHRTVQLRFTNVSTVEHNLVFLDEIQARSREIVLPGETDVIVFMTPEAGTYGFQCTIHEEMRGTLIVR